MRWRKYFEGEVREMDSRGRENGFSLIEVLVALAVLAVVIVTFTALFTSSFAGISIAGDKSVELYNAQTEMDDAIARGALSDNDTVQIDFSLTLLNISGEIVSVDYEYEERSGTLVYFLPEE